MNAVEVHGFADDLPQVDRLAANLGVSSAAIGLHQFPDGEVMPTVRVGAETVIIYRSLHHLEQRLLPLLLAADAYRQAGAARLVLAAPYLSYLRQDAVFQLGQPLSRDVVGRLLGRAFDRVVTVQAHLHRTTDLSAVFGCAVDNISALSALAQDVAGAARPLVVGPDVEARPWAQAAAERLQSDWMTFDKTRQGDRSVTLTAPSSPPIDGREVLLLDDVCSTGETLIQAIAQLRQAGASAIDVAVVHALFDQHAEHRLRAAGARRIVSTDSIPHSTNALELAGLLASALKDEVLP
jgi:ribose-phosphate pyrophosphokinase